MAKTLLIGASSTIAKSLQEVSNKEFLTFSRAEGNLDLEGDLSELDDVADINGLVYFPGTINLKPFSMLKEDDFMNDFQVNVLGAAKIVKKVINRLEISNNDIVLGVWRIEESQKGILGQCVISNEKVIKVIDKDKNCNEELFWGLIAWKPTFTKFIKSKDSHFGISINRAIENNLNVGFLLSDSKYYDCGTFNEYKDLLDNISN